MGPKTPYPGVNAWASRKGRAMVFGVNAPKQEFPIDALVLEVSSNLDSNPARFCFAE